MATIATLSDVKSAFDDSEYTYPLGHGVDPYVKVWLNEEHDCYALVGHAYDENGEPIDGVMWSCYEADGAPMGGDDYARTLPEAVLGLTTLMIEQL